MKMKMFLYVFSFFCLFSIMAKAENFSKQKIVVENVVDGDTIYATILENKRFVIIRFADIDCLEQYIKSKRLQKQVEKYGLSRDEILKRGKIAKEKLQDILKKHEKNIWFKETPEKICKNNHNRLVGIVYAGDINVNEYMLNNADCTVFNCSED